MEPCSPPMAMVAGRTYETCFLADEVARSLDALAALLARVSVEEEEDSRRRSRSREKGRR